MVWMAFQSDLLIRYEMKDKWGKKTSYSQWNFNGKYKWHEKVNGHHPYIYLFIFFPKKKRNKIEISYQCCPFSCDVRKQIGTFVANFEIERNEKRRKKPYQTWFFFHFSTQSDSETWLFLSVCVLYFFVSCCSCLNFHFGDRMFPSSLLLGYFCDGKQQQLIQNGHLCSKWSQIIAQLSIFCWEIKKKAWIIRKH